MCPETQARNKPAKRAPARRRMPGPAPRRAWLARACFLALALLAPPAAAQTRDDVQLAIERTDQVLQRADAVLAGSSNQLALDYLDHARPFQARAKTAFSVGLYGDAQRLTDAARRRAFAAIELAQQEGSAGFLQFAIERTDAFLDRIAPFLADCPNEPAARLFTAALDLQRQAKDALRQGRPRVALSLTNNARGRATRALRLAEASCGENSDRAKRAVERTDQLLEDSSWLSDAGDRAERAFAAARDEQMRAKRQLGQDHYAEALDFTLRARDQLVRALGRADRPLARQAVAEAVQRSQERLDQARTSAAGNTALAAIERASDRKRRDQDLLERGRLAACLADVHAVRTILERAGL